MLSGNSIGWGIQHSGYRRCGPRNALRLQGPAARCDRWRQTYPAPLPAVTQRKLPRRAAAGAAAAALGPRGPPGAAAGAAAAAAAAGVQSSFGSAAGGCGASFLRRCLRSVE
jgi:hypothetical protein